MLTVKGGSLPRTKSQLPLSGVPLQKIQGRLVKLIHLLIDGCMGTSLKNHQLSLLNVLLQWVSKSDRRDQVVPTERDLSWCLDLAELSLRVVGEYCLGLSHECIERLAGLPLTKAARG